MIEERLPGAYYRQGQGAKGVTWDYATTPCGHRAQPACVDYINQTLVRSFYHRTPRAKPRSLQREQIRQPPQRHRNGAVVQVNLGQYGFGSTTAAQSYQPSEGDGE